MVDKDLLKQIIIENIELVKSIDYFKKEGYSLRQYALCFFRIKTSW